MKPNDTDLKALIKQQVDERETLADSLGKLEALAATTMLNDFLDQDTDTVSSYLWTLCGLIQQARSVNNESLNSLLAVARSLKL